MPFPSLLLVALGLSLDAFGASVSRAAVSPSLATVWRRAVSIVRDAAVFGLFATAAPLAGWTLGRLFYEEIEAFDHWLAFVFLASVGAKMVYDGWRETKPNGIASTFRATVLVVAAMATSVDTAAVGITLPVFDIPILVAATLIGGVTLLASVAGSVIGRSARTVIGQYAEIAGGLVLIAIGTKIVIQHTI